MDIEGSLSDSAWNAAIEAAAWVIENETGDSRAIAARASIIRGLKREPRTEAALTPRKATP